MTHLDSFNSNFHPRVIQARGYLTRLLNTAKLILLMTLLLGSGTVLQSHTLILEYNTNLSLADTEESLNAINIGQAISFGALDAKVYGDAPFVISATGGASGNPVVFTSSDATVATCTGINGSTITILKAGVCTIYANQEGDAIYDAAVQVTRTLSIATKELTVSGATVTNKIYDRTTEASISGAVIEGVESGDDVNLADDAVGTFASANAATGVSVSTNMSLKGTSISNYHLTQPVGLVGDILIKELTVSGVSVVNKIYDGTTKATVSGAVLEGVVFGDNVYLGDETVGTFVSADVGSGISVSTNMSIQGTDKSNYSIIQPMGLVADIAVKELTVSGAVVANKVYDGTTQATITGAKLDGVVLGDEVVLADATIGFFVSADADESVSVSTIMSLSGNKASNYSLELPTGLMADISHKLIIVTVDANQTKEYGEADPTLTYTSNMPLADGDVFSGALEREAGEAVNTYVISQGNLSLNANYELSVVGSTFAITHRLLTVTVNANQTKVYGAAEPTLTYTPNRSLADGDVFSGALERVAGETVNTYVISQGNLSLNANYELSFVGSTFSITPKPIIVTVDANQMKEYGTSDPTLIYTTNVPLVVGDAFSGSLIREAGEEVNTYAILQGSLSLSANYELSFVGSTFSIIKLLYSIYSWPTAEGIMYGKALSDATLSGGNASIDGTFAYTDATITPYAGVYSASITFTPTDETSYNSFASHIDVTVSKATPSITSAPLATAITYGQTLASAALSGGNASVDGSFAYTDVTITPYAGVYSAFFTFTPTDAVNYNTVVSKVNVTVNKATPSITSAPIAAVITYGQSLTNATLSGGNASVDGSFAYTDVTITPYAGVYSAFVTFTPTDAVNYNTVVSKVNVTVNKATSSITTAPIATAITYGQSLTNATLSGGSTSVEGSFAYSDATITPNAGTADYDVIFTPSDAVNYKTLTIKVSVDVAKAKLTATALDANKNQGEANPSFTVKLTGFVLGDDQQSIQTLPIATCVAESTSAAGDYPILASGGFDLNYNFTYEPGNLKISATSAVKDVVNTTATVWPNPTRGELFVSANLIGKAFGIYTLAGSLILQNTSAESMIDLSDLKPGVYMVIFEDARFKVSKQ